MYVALVASAWGCRKHKYFNQRQPAQECVCLCVCVCLCLCLCLCLSVCEAVCENGRIYRIYTYNLYMNYFPVFYRGKVGLNFLDTILRLV